MFKVFFKDIFAQTDNDNGHDTDNGSSDLSGVGQSTSQCGKMVNSELQMPNDRLLCHHSPYKLQNTMKHEYANLSIELNALQYLNICGHEHAHECAPLLG